MIDIDNILENAKYIKESIPDAIDDKINYTLKYKCVRKNKKSLKNIMQMITYLITFFIAGTGIVFASTQIYKQYIKKQDEMQSSKLYELGDGITYNEIDLRLTDMTWNNEYGLYFKAITNAENYEIYKVRIQELPDIQDINFNENFLLIITIEKIDEPHKKDLEIYDISTSENETQIVLKQKENPNYDDNSNIYYAIIDKTLLKEKIDIKIQYPTISSEKFIDIEQIPKDYSTESAIKDGCIVIEKNKLLSNNINLLDNFVENADTNDFLRVYIKDEDGEIIIKDVKCINNIYYEKVVKLDDLTENISFNSYKDLHKVTNDLGIFYNWAKYGEDDNSMYPLVVIQNY